MLRLIELLLNQTTRLLQREALKYQRQHEKVLAKIDAEKDAFEVQLTELRARHSNKQRELRLANIEACGRHAKCERLSSKLKELQA